MVRIFTDGFEPYGLWGFIGSLTEGVIGILTNCSGVPEPAYMAIIHHDDGPMCCLPDRQNLESIHRRGIIIPKEDKLSHIVYLGTEAVRWSQWIYQLSHEVCHSLTGGRLSGEMRGLKWFEECLCEAASLFCLSKISNPTIWRQWGYPRYAPCVQSYLDNHLSGSLHLRRQYYSWNDLEQHQGIRPWLDALGETSTRGMTECQRTLCNAVASVLLPAFLRSPRLWRIIGHIGDSEKWRSLEEFLSHLESEMPETFHADLSELSRILLGKS